MTVEACLLVSWLSAMVTLLPCLSCGMSSLALRPNFWSRKFHFGPPKIIFSRNYFNLGYLTWIKLPWGKWDQNKSQTRINLYEDQVLSFNMMSWVYFNFCCNQSVNVSLTHTPCHALSALCITESSQCSLYNNAFCPTLLHLPLWLVKCF